jgi:putative membrane-bound dehydrogenase-like protein
MVTILQGWGFMRLHAIALSLFLGSAAYGQGLSPQEAVKKMTVADGFEVRLVASEPQIRQPLSISFDLKGRIWVIQYLQYPAPAGLKAVKVDEYLRTTYDRVPEPPPKGPKGADKITILEDKDGDGFYETTKDFVTGLNITSGMCLGHGGVFVVQVPYLLFYPDKNGDDVPDGDPEVLLSGFGMEDTHSLANSLQWGPDGWLYGAAGSTSTSKINGIEFQQGIWRYHPVTKKFELFAEGGGNTWGLDFDRHGNVIAGTNWGGWAMLHQVQGAYYLKGFSKHGPLHNPNTYGYFEHVPYANFKGGHVTCGGTVYQGGAFPKQLDDQYIACNVLSNDVYWHVIERKGSSFTNRFGGDLLVSNDKWFRPIDTLIGPDGAVYIVDWYDARANHVDPRNNWDKTNGRIYRISHKDAPKYERLDLDKMTSVELVEVLKHPNVWYRSEARRILAERHDQAVTPKLLTALHGATNAEALWALYVSGGLQQGVSLEMLKNPNEDVRAWTIRLGGDDGQLLANAFTDLAQTEPSPVVRNQLACTAKRLPHSLGLPIVRALLKRSEDLDDPQIPMLLWWAIEDKAIKERERVLALFDKADDWKAPITEKFILERIGRRYMVEGDDAACARLLNNAPSSAHQLLLVKGMDKALEGRRLERIPAALEKPVAAMLKEQPEQLALLSFAIRLGSEDAYATSLTLLGKKGQKEADTATLIAIIGQVGKADGLPALLPFLQSRSATLQGSALSALQAYQDPSVTAAILQALPGTTGALRSRALTLLSARPQSALGLVRLVDSGALKPAEIPVPELQRIAAFEDAEIAPILQKHWGKVGPATDGEKRAQIHSIKNILSKGKGQGDRVRGHAIFLKTCAVCHTLWDEGNKIGPELTGADRKNIDVLAMNIVDPSAVIRAEFGATQIKTTSGQILVGLLVEQNAQSVTVLDANNVRTVVAREKIEISKPAALSLMPEKLLNPLSDPEILDFFAYVMGDGPLSAAQAPKGTQIAWKPADTLPGTAVLDKQGDLSAELVAGIDRFLLREIEASVEKRAALWKRDVSSKDAYEKSIAPNREHLKKILGIVDERTKDGVPEFPVRASQAGLGAAMATSAAFQVRPVRWPVFRNVEAEGLFLVPKAPDAPLAIVFPDADQTPEMLAGVVAGLPEEQQIARRLAEHGSYVLVLTVIDRSDTYSVSQIGRTTNQPHREFVYRPAFEMGRTLIGYEIQKALAFIDYLDRQGRNKATQIGVFGVGEGGLLALYAGAVDPRIDVTWVGGYFESRQKAWQEPIYRNVFGLLREFGDAEIASLIAPRALITSNGPAIEIKGPPAPRPGRSGAAPGIWSTPEAASTQKEFDRFMSLVKGLPAPEIPQLLDPQQLKKPLSPVKMESDGPDQQKRLKRQFDQLLEDTQVLLRQSERVRDAGFWKRVDRKTIPDFEKSTAPLREEFYNDVIGKFDQPFLPPNPRSRLVYDEPKWRGYEVVLDVFPDVYAYGILLLPKDLKEGERRPCVVTQHGLEGRPQDVADPKKNVPAYGQYACKLADRGFVVFAPQNCYLGKDLFRTLQRKANLLGKQLFSIIIPQHQVITDWLAAQPYVDPERIAFYGISYGGKTAMRVPAVIKRYCLSICSADFNEWIWKNASLDNGYTYVTTGEYEIFEWNLGNTYNYAEMAALIAPRPFMVERGHGDGVAPDERVLYEWAKVKRFYDELKIGDRAEIEVFDGPHKINGVGTFDFLHKQLQWPKPN